MAQILFGYHPDWMVGISQLIDHSRFNPSFAPFAHVDLAAFDLVVPLTIHHYWPLRDRPDVRSFVPDAVVVTLCDDKLAFARWAVNAGFGDAVPPVLEADAVVYPHVVKPRHGEFGSGIRMICGPAEDSPIDEATQFRQQAVTGTHEYVLHLLRADGKVLYAQAYRYDMGGPLSIRGAEQAPLDCVAVDPGPALPVAQAVLDRLDYRGTCCLNYKIDVTGAVKLLEINPRFGGSLVGDINRYIEASLAAISRVA